MAMIFHFCYKALFLCIFHFIGVQPTVLEKLFGGIIWGLDEKFLPPKKICINFCQVPGGTTNMTPAGPRLGISTFTQKIWLRSHLLLVQSYPKGIALWAPSILGEGLLLDFALHTDPVFLLLTSYLSRPSQWRFRFSGINKCPHGRIRFCTLITFLSSCFSFSLSLLIPYYFVRSLKHLSVGIFSYFSRIFFSIETLIWKNIAYHYRNWKFTHTYPALWVENRPQNTNLSLRKATGPSEGAVWHCASRAEQREGTKKEGVCSRGRWEPPGVPGCKGISNSEYFKEELLCACPQTPLNIWENKKRSFYFGQLL